MTDVPNDFIEINLSTDELMLKELERRDGIYSFIFHELDVPKPDTPTPNTSPDKLVDVNYITTTTIATTTTTTIIDEVNANTDSDSSSLSDELKIKAETIFKQRSQFDCPTSTNTAATATKTIVFSVPATTSFINTFPIIKGTGSTATTTGATTIIVPSLFAASPLTTPSTTAASTAINGVNATLPYFPSSLSGIGMRSYHEYLKTWHPPSSLVYDNPKLYTYMANCGFRVRVPTPRFSHISAPLVRNRRHALKQTPEYKQITDSKKYAHVADLRALFPHDPDVHAPFAAAGGMTITSSTTLGNGELEDVLL
ncbi:uncharacterized protein LOC129239007 [Anastrepha obliqua]|uniref:uncharacterized protein LOC129239007 n=1 Tax=Anastrepha obliqua TaxID=95512 RepID=UPI002408F5AF|nr:uncharacterized protein LOC129239007 [Anastrepha obliqua]